MELVEPVQQYHQQTEFDTNTNISQHSQFSQQSQHSQQSQGSQNQSHSNHSQTLPQQNEDNQSHHSHSSHNTDNSQNKQPPYERLQEQNSSSPQEHNAHPHNLYQREQVQREPIYQRHGYVHRHPEQVQVIPENSVAPPVKYRQNSDPRRNERDFARQRLAHRHTYYQSDERENPYDRILQNQNREPQYGEFGRPGSRSGITESAAVPFTHYVNYNELQTHISRKQHQYHSQRQPRSDSLLRPVSNYYEYESVQSVLNNRQMIRQNNNPVPLHSSTNAQLPHSIYSHDVNSNHLQSRQQNLVVQSRPSGPQQGSSRNNVMPRQAGVPHRGPFVTQVTIGDHQKNGTKV